MKVKHEARTLDGDIVEPEHTIEQVCLECGYDLDESELAADTCSDCGEPLALKENVAIVVTTLPPILGRA